MIEMTETNILTMDVEDWTSSSLFLLSKREARVARQYVSINDPQVERGVGTFLDLLEEMNGTATFFVMGETAKGNKELIRRIQTRGHEVASHSMTHSILSGLSGTQLGYELSESKKLLEDMLGEPVLGFRAPNLEIYHDVPGYFQKLQDAGYVYDSSLTATAARRMLRMLRMLKYSKPGEPSITEENGVIEIPVTMHRYLFWKIPLGGTYLALLGEQALSAKIHRENALGKKPVVLYVHPYELAGLPLRWAHPSPTLRAKLSLMLRNTRKGHHYRLLTHLLKNHRFTSIKSLKRLQQCSSEAII